MMLEIILLLIFLTLLSIITILLVVFRTQKRFEERMLGEMFEGYIVLRRDLFKLRKHVRQLNDNVTTSGDDIYE